VQRFYDVVFNQRRASAAVEFIREDYVQHSPYLADGREPFVDYFGTFLAEYPDSRIDVKRLVAEGDYVVVHSHFTRWPSDRGTAIVDIYRLEDGRLVEHWDVTEDVPERAANRNTVF
jgi:predicted SnoaL-like aldol condensation-catalyzing enzyme